MDIDIDDLEFVLNVGFMGAAAHNGSGHLHGPLTANFDPDAGDRSQDPFDGTTTDARFGLTPGDTLSVGQGRCRVDRGARRPPAAVLPVRSPSSGVRQFLLDLAARDGADASADEAGLVAPPSPPHRGVGARN